MINEESKAVNRRFNFEEVKKKLKEDNAFLSNLLKILPNIKLREEDSDGSSPYLLPSGKGDQKVPGPKEGCERAKSLEELHARLKELSGKKLEYKDKLLRKKLRNQMKKKKRSKDLSMKKTMVKLPKPEKEAMVAAVNGFGSRKPSKPVFNSAGKMVFSKFDFRSDELPETNAGKGKKEDPKKLLERLKNEKAEVEEAGEDVKKSKSWATVLARSRGEKVLDDPELLKKSINRAESKKRSSRKKWVEREKNVNKKMEEREAKRASAIANKKQEKKSKKMKSAIKKGRFIPGFS